MPIGMAAETAMKILVTTLTTTTMGSLRFIP